MKVGIIIQARMGSKRLPGKVLKEISGKTLLEILINRIKGCGLPVVVATTTEANDDVLAEKLLQLNIPCFRGSEDDVLSRFYKCALEHKLDAVIRLTADNPFIKDELITAVTSLFVEENKEELYMSTEKYPLGVALEIFSFKALKDAFINAKDSKEREHVTPYIINDPQIIKKFVQYKADKEHYRLTIDTDADFKLAKALIEDYQAENLTIDALIALLDEHPELVEINATVYQKKWNE